MGSPTGASSYVGVLDKNQIRIVTFYRHNYLDTYYEGTKESVLPTSLTKSYFNFGGLTLSYGISKHFTAETDLGYFFNKTQIYNFSGKEFQVNGYGLSNGTATIKYAAYKNLSRLIEVTVGLGLKFPFSQQPLYVDGTRLAIDLQPSSNAFGISVPLIFIKEFSAKSIRLMFLNKFEKNFSNPDHYIFGSSASNSLFISKRIFSHLMLLMQLRNDFRFSDLTNGDKAVNTGSDVVTFSPHLSYTLGKNLHIAGLFDIPVFKNYIGHQLGLKYAFAFSLTKTFDLNSSQK